MGKAYRARASVRMTPLFLSLNCFIRWNNLKNRKFLPPFWVTSNSMSTTRLIFLPFLKQQWTNIITELNVNRKIENYNFILLLLMKNYLLLVSQQIVHLSQQACINVLLSYFQKLNFRLGYLFWIYS